MNKPDNYDALFDLLDKISSTMPPMQREYKRPDDVCLVVGPNGVAVPMHTEVAEQVGLVEAPDQ